MISILTSYVVPAIHILACLFLIVVVLLQTGKGADMGAVFGGGSQTLFGSGGAGNFLTRLTTGTAIAFMVTSLILTYGASRPRRSTLIDQLPAVQDMQIPEAGDTATGDEAATENDQAADAAPAEDAMAPDEAPAPDAPADHAAPDTAPAQP